ncbi:lipopolysaccharide biosynthesis protein [Variovorax sp. KK3]|uniref:lipopolysaccharide biosynthesis protein n=1 Tax=Variovorax sp. KK3 TaxID=1855728 RepID=UPI0015C38E72|nr:oligosaccharide flippase family protein [Variovorax sp. KK3]
MSASRDKYLAYGSQLYAAGLLVILLPSYLAQLGSEQFALMMMFFVAQGWIQIADFGFPLALSREIAIARREHRSNEIGALLNAMQRPMLLGMLMVGLAMLVICIWIAGQRTEGLAVDGSAIGLAVLAAVLALTLRWASELYRAALAGAEQFLALAAVNSCGVTARLAAALVVLGYVGGGISTWLFCQVLVSLTEILSLAFLCRRGLSFSLGNRPKKSVDVLLRLWPMAAQIAAASAIWISITQLDKLILSQLLPLRDYGAVAIAATIPAGLLALALPLLQVSYPALIRLHRSSSRCEQTRLYLATTEITCCLLLPTAALCIAFPADLLQVWFAHALDHAGIEAVPLVPLYALGASFLALSSMPYGLLNAAGELRAHILGSLSLAVCMAACLTMGSLNLGAVGAITLWCGSASLFFLVWPQVVHRKHLEGGPLPWIRSIARFAVPLGLMAWVLKSVFSDATSSLHFRLAELAAIWALLQGIAGCVLASRYLRRWRISS